MDLDTWLATVSDQLGTADALPDNDAVHTLLDLARDTAHEVERVAAPLTSYLVGVAVGRGASLGAIAAQLTGLILTEDGSAGESDTSV